MRRDTSLVRRLIENQLKSGKVECVWTGSDLRRKRHDTGHCFPWSRWSNNELWNLMRSSATANAKKAEKLPADSVLKESQGLILDWWDAAIMGTGREHEFFAEAESSLPLVDKSTSIERVFDGMLQQQLRLKTNLQLAEWMGLRNRNPTP